MALRRLITSTPSPTTTDGETDLSAVLAGVVPTNASLAVPADPVPLPAATVAELAAVVREATTNTLVHAGPDAGLWVLVEDAADGVTLSVRDDGPGIPDGRLATAEAEGHLGVASSICARVRTLGGTVTLHTGPEEGTEWEIHLARRPG